MPRVWLLPGFLLAVILGLTAAGVFSTSLLLDMVAWWPVWALVAVAAALVGRRRMGKVRVGGILAIVLSGALVALVIGHFSGWGANPSASRHLIGPARTDFEVAELRAAVDGDLRLRSGSPFLYRVEPILGGGDLGLPSAEERSSESSISVELQASPTPGLDRYAGWDISLSDAPRWTLTLRGNLDVDLTGLTVTAVDVAGIGTLRLGPGESSSVVADGAFTIVVPPGSPVRVVGAARVPASWQPTDEGWSSPAEGPGWMITVLQGGVVTIEES